MITIHTPGPWKCQKSNDGKFYTIGDRQSSWGTRVAEVYADDIDGYEAKANAALIAAAPELYVVLDEFSAFMGGNPTQEAVVSYLWLALLPRSTAVLKKAREE